MDVPQNIYNVPMAKESRPWLKALLVASLLATAAAVAGILMLPDGIHHQETLPTVRGVSSLVYPTAQTELLEQPVGGDWLLPADAVVSAGHTFVLDTANSRILKLDAAGGVVATFDGTSDERLALDQPMDIATDGKRLFVANSLAGEVVILDLMGRVETTLPVPAGLGAAAPRPIGIALTDDGGIVLADADNHRIVALGESGGVLWELGNGARASGLDGFNVPGALATDSAGNIYVADVLNGRVVKLSPEGAFLGQFGELGETAGALARPKGVAVDAQGRVFVSDGLQAAVQVYSADGSYIGVIGRSDSPEPASDSIFKAPAGLFLDGDRLFVTDRRVGLVTMQLLEPPVQDTSDGDAGHGG